MVTRDRGTRTSRPRWVPRGWATAPRRCRWRSIARSSSPRPASWCRPALDKLDKGGTVALAGIHMTPIPQMDYGRSLFYERDVRSVTANTRADGRELLELAGSIPIRPRTTVYPLDQANEALADLKADRISGTGVLVVRPSN